MYQLKRNGMKILKIIHLLGACFWIGGAACMLLLNISNDMAKLDGVLYGINMASHMIDMWIIVRFGALVCLITGIIYGYMTPWRFIKYGWITVKWIFTIICIMSGTFFLGVCVNNMLALSNSLGISSLENANYLAIREKHFLMSILQIIFLFLIVILSVTKPRKYKKMIYNN